MDEIIIKKVDVETAKIKIKPNLIYNRPDLFAESFEYYKVIEHGSEQYIAIIFDGDTAILCAWLVLISIDATKKMIRQVFKENKDVKCIKYEYICNNVGLAKRKDHYRIELPKTEEELHSRLSKKGRYNIKREKRLLKEVFTECLFLEASAEEIPTEVVEKFFEMKEKTHGIRYGLTSSEYLKKYHVTNVYWIVVNQRIISVLMSCEQCKTVYLENLTYDIEYSKYSVGQIIYDVYLERLIEKGYKNLYLAGGDLNYKKRYGSIKEEAYVGIIYRNALLTLMAQLKNFLRGIRDKIKGKR